MQSCSATHLPQVPKPEIPMEPTHHTYDRTENHWIHYVKILNPRPNQNSKDDTQVDPNQNTPWQFPNNYHQHPLPHLPTAPRNTPHVHQCNHPTQNKIYQTLQLQLSKLFFKYNLDPHLYQMYWLGLQNTHTKQTQHTINMYPPSFHNIFLSQSEIGWKQLHYSQLSKHWTHYLSQNHPEIDATTFYAKILTLT